MECAARSLTVLGRGVREVRPRRARFLRRRAVRKVILEDVTQLVPHLGLRIELDERGMRLAIAFGLLRAKHGLRIGGAIGAAWAAGLAILTAGAWALAGDASSRPWTTTAMLAVATLYSASVVRARHRLA